MAFSWAEITTPDTSGRTVRDLCYAPELDLFVAVGSAGLVMTSPTGEVWTLRTASDTHDWRGVAWNGTVFAAVSTGASNQVMTSPDGITWTARTSAEINAWQSVCWASGLTLFVAVATSGTNRVMTSADGITWGSAAASAAKSWSGVAWSEDLTLLAAVASNTGSSDIIMTSPDGTNWTTRTTAANLEMSGVTFGSSPIAWSPAAAVFCFCSRTGSARSMTTSPDGLTWTEQSIPNNTVALGGVVSAPLAGGFIATRQSGTTRIITSADGLTWEAVTTGVDRSWSCAAWAEELGVFVSWDDGAVADAMLRGVYGDVGSVTPARGTYLGGTVVTVSGVGFTGATSVVFGGLLAAGVVVTNDTTLTCITPAHATGLVDVEVVGVATLTGGYTFVSVERVSPKAGTAAGGTAVTITGFGFAGATSVLFDGVAATSVVVVSNTTITAVTPLHASGAVNVEVVGVGTLTAGYTYSIGVELLPPIPVLSPVEATAPPGTISAPWQRWLQIVKQRIEQAPTLFAEQITGVFNPDQIPELPFTRITLTTAPRLLGRTSAGAGPSEEIRVAAGLTLTGGILSLSGLPGGYVIGDLLYADSDRTLARLADVSAGSYLRSGGVATAPLWSTLKLPNAATSGDILKASGADTYASAAPAALTKTDDTNVTLTLGGSAASALVNAASLTLGWTGTLAAARLNANVVQAVVDDTNVTGVIATQALTIGWTGTLALTRGGVGADVSTIAKGGLLVGTAAGTIGIKAVGANDEVLTADSTVAGGVKWAAAAGGGTVTGSGTTGSLAQWSSASALTDGPVAANVALLSTANTFTASGNSFGAGGAGATSLLVVNGSSASGAGVYQVFRRGGADKFYLGTHSALIGGTSDAMALFAVDAIEFYSGNSASQRFGINAAGDWLQGSSIMDSVGIPTATSGFTSPTITGNDYSFSIVFSTATLSGAVITFGRTFANPPNCSVTPGSPVIVNASTTTTTLTITTSGNVGNLMILCRGY